MKILKKINDKVFEVLINNRGDLVQFVGILVVILLVIKAVLPSLGGAIETMGTNAIEDLGKLELVITP
jgi:hypothetical protein